MTSRSTDNHQRVTSSVRFLGEPTMDNLVVLIKVSAQEPRGAAATALAPQHYDATPTMAKAALRAWFGYSDTQEPPAVYIPHMQHALDAATAAYAAKGVCEWCGEGEPITPNVEVFELTDQIVCDDCAETVLEGLRK